MPNQLNGVVIHSLVSDSLQDANILVVICIDKIGNEHNLYKKWLFTPDAVQKYINGGKSRIIINLLQYIPVSMTSTFGLSQNSIIADTILTQEVHTDEINVVNNQFHDNTCENVPTYYNQNSTEHELVIDSIQVNTQSMLPLSFKDNKEL